MGRHKKQTVDYFPHIIKNGKTITILENKFGNDGYAFWFKLLEILGSTDGHFYEYKNTSEKEFLHARTNLNEETVQQILALLANLGAIDKQLWKEDIIWSDNFVKNIEDVYSRRKIDVPQKPQVSEKDVPQKPQVSEKDVNINPQSKVKESKVKNIFSHWKEKSETITHRKLTSKMESAVNARLEDGYTIEELKEAIDNYNMVVGSDKYFFTYDNWSLDDFLSRGEGKQVEKFLEKPESFRKDEEDKQPVTADKNIVDYTPSERKRRADNEK